MNNHMDMDMSVRHATAGDAPAIAAIYNQGIEDRCATFETELRDASDIVAMLRERGVRYPTIVVERAGNVVAWAAASAYSSRPCYAGIAEFSVYVERSARGSGTGRAAMEGLLKAAEERGIWKLVSRVFPENTASLSLLAKLGFLQIGVHKRHSRLDGVWKDCVVVERLLGAALENPAG
jgi:L-amino acid N-acyltransferase YncA